jgi:hypothetical protein
MMNEPLDDLIMIPTLQHMVFCPRQCALMQILGTASLTAAKRGGLLA